MIEKRHLHQGCSGGDPLGQLAICSAGTGVSGGMVVNEEKSVGLMQNDGVKNVARVRNSFVEASIRDGVITGGAETRVEKGQSQGFVIEETHLWREDTAGCLRAVQHDLIGLFTGNPRTHFEGCGQLGSLGEPEAVFASELRNFQATERGQSAVVAEESLPHFDRALTLHPNAQEDGQQLRIAEGGRPQLGHLLAGAFLVGQVVNDHSSTNSEEWSDEQPFRKARCSQALKRAFEIGEGRMAGRLVKNFTSSRALGGMEAVTPWRGSENF